MTAMHFPDPDIGVAGRLTGRRIVVTGAASGIGRSIAKLFVEAGARVALLDRSPASLPAGADGAALAMQADVTDPDAVAGAIDRAAAAFGGIDGLVNAAGITNTQAAEDVALADWKRLIDVNLTGTFVVCRACLPQLRKAGGGTIVNLASALGLLPFKLRGAYSASKAGVIALSRVIAMEWAPEIRVNTICPGAIDTPMVQAQHGDAALHTQVGARYALGRIGMPIEVAQAALYLTSAESSFVTGVALAVDGGRSYH